jgi:hypothetical protein
MQMIEDYDRYFSKIEVIALMDCVASYLDTEDCSWYHRNWMTLRSLGMVSNPFWHERFFTEQLKIYFDHENSKVLVLGTADFSMPLLCFYSGIKQLDICDICKTPLNICNVVAEQNQFDWKTFKKDIRDGIDNKYSIIVSDAFLTRFSYEEKPKILKSIGQALLPGGVYITTIRNGWNGGKAVFPTQKQKNGFVKKARRLAQKKGIEVASAQESAATYIERMISFPMKSQESLSQMAQGIMDVLSCTIAEVTGEYRTTNYFQVVFRKK